jgi:hypothetical protein
MRILPPLFAPAVGADASPQIATGEALHHSKHDLVASDFDQTLSFNDSGEVLSDLLGRPGFKEKVDGLAGTHLVQQGGELAYLLLHDPEYRCVRKEHLAEVGRHIRLKQNIEALIDILATSVDGHRFSFHVISAAPEEVVRSALEGIVPPENIHGTIFDYDPASGEIRSVSRLTAGHGKVAVLDELQAGTLGDRQEINYQGHARAHINPTRQRGDRRCHALASAGVPGWRVGLV